MTTSNNCSLLKDVIAYVDVWSKDRMANYSKPFVEQLQKMGAQVSKTFNKQVTHVVFNNGHPATWRKAKKSDVRLVSVLWVSRCSDDGVRVDEGLFPASDETNPVLKNKRHRCMLPKDSPERTPDNSTRMRKKLDKMRKDLAPKQQYVTDVSPVIIDEENGIVYSPGLKRSDYMAKRLKDMKEKHENLSPTASQMVESCSPTGLKPSLGSTPTVPKFMYDHSDDDSSASAAEPAYSPDKEEGRTQGPEKPWLSPCHDLPKRISHLNKSEKGKQKATKSFTETKTEFLPDAVNSPSCLSSPAMLDDAAVRLSEEVCTPKRKQKTPKRGRTSSSAVVRSFARSGDIKSVASCSTGEDDSVFEDFLSPANQRKSKRPPLPNLPVESDIQVPFELCSVPNKRKLRRSESITSEMNSKKKKKEPVDRQKGQQCDAEPPSRRQQDVEKSVESQSVTHGPKRRRQSTLPFTSTSKASDGVKQGGASSSAQSALLTEADTVWKLQKNSDVSVPSRTLENDWADNDSAPAAEPAYSADKEELRTRLDVADHGHCERRPRKGSEKPSLSPCHDLPKQISRLSKSEKGKQKATKSFTETKTEFPPKAVNSPSCLSSPAMLDDAAVRLSEEVCTPKRKQKTPKRGRSSSSAAVRSLARSGDTKSFASGATGEDDSVFEDYFSPANHRKSKRPPLPNLPVESDIQVPFELCSVPNKRKLRRSESITSETNSKKKRKLEESQKAEISDELCDAEPPSRRQQDVEKSVESQSVTHGPKRRRQSTLPFTSTSKASDGVKQGGASSSAQSALLTEADTVWKLQKNSDVSVPSRTLESRGNDCTDAAALTEIPSEGEESQSDDKQVGASFKEMVNKTQAKRTLVMTSMPTEKQQTVCQLVQALGGFSIVHQVCESTTHVVSGSHRRTLNVLLGIARGCWILSFEWILWCLEQRQWIPEEPYELSDHFPAAQICRLQRHLSAGEHQQDLFQSQPAMFVSRQSQPPTQSLVELIQLCGGTVCKTVRRAGICIGKCSSRRPEGSRILSEQWVLDSITHLKPLSYDNYDLE